jgi:two-component system response regulator FixJ
MRLRPGHGVVVLGARAGLTRELQTALAWRDGPSPFLVTSRMSPRSVDPCTCELLVVEVDGPGSRGLKSLAECRNLYPCLPAIALIARGDIAAAVAATSAGAVDCLERPLEADRTMSAVAAIVDPGRSACPPIYSLLTRTEVCVLHLILAGRTNGEMAYELSRSPRTIETHRRNIMQKVGAAGLVDLVRRAVSMGISSPQGNSSGVRSLKCEV